MSRRTFPVLLGALLVAMATSAPLANQEKVEATKPEEQAVDIAKRADEKIVFGNQQNEARVMSKKSDLSAVLESQADPALGEVDQGSKVVVHKEMPVEKDLAERADAARADFENEDKIADAMEAAMSSVDRVAEEKEEEEREEGTEEVPVSETEQESANTEDQSASIEESVANNEVNSPAESEVVPLEAVSEDNVADVVDENSSGAADAPTVAEDEDIQDLMQATGAGQPEDIGDVMADQMSQQASSGVETEAEAAEGNLADDSQVVQESDSQQQANPESGDNPAVQGDDEAESEREADYYRQMYQYMVNSYQGNGQNPSKLPYYFFRRRRSLAGSKQGAGRRIKRDLLDDAEENPILARYIYGEADDSFDRADAGSYNTPNAVLDMGDALISDPDDYVPLTEADADDLYKEIEDYLEWELDRRENAERLKEYLENKPLDIDDASDVGELVDDLEQPQEGYYGVEPDDVKEEEEEEAERAYLERENPFYSMGMKYPSDNPYDYVTSKRGGESSQADFRFPAVATRKRYFFPFADEPETHWGAFVPEKRARTAEDEKRSTYLDDNYQWREPEYRRSLSKREYNEAIQRLQRLAMALSDNRGPYFNEVIQDQPYKK